MDINGLDVKNLKLRCSLEGSEEQRANLEEELHQLSRTASSTPEHRHRPTAVSFRETGWTSETRVNRLMRASFNMNIYQGCKNIPRYSHRGSPRSGKLCLLAGSLRDCEAISRLKWQERRVILKMKARFEEAIDLDFDQPLKPQATPTTKVVPPLEGECATRVGLPVTSSPIVRIVDEELQLSHMERPCLGDSHEGDVAAVIPQKPPNSQEYRGTSTARWC